MRESFEFIKFMADLLLGVLLVIFGFGAFVGYVLIQPTCYARAEAMKLEADWGLFQGCIVQTEQGPLPIEAYVNRVIEQNIAIRSKN
jgi:hypothetical protein